MINDVFEMMEEIDRLSKLRTSFSPGELVVSGPKGAGLFPDAKGEAHRMHEVVHGMPMIVVAQQGMMILVVTSGGLVGWTMFAWVDPL